MQAYAKKIRIFDHLEKSMMTLLQGLVEAILTLYTEASQHICSERGFDNLVKRSTKFIRMSGLVESKGKSNFCLKAFSNFRNFCVY